MKTFFTIVCILLCSSSIKAQPTCPVHLHQKCPIDFYEFSDPTCHRSDPICDGVMCTIQVCSYAHPIINGASVNMIISIPGVIQKVEKIQSVNCANPTIVK